MTLVRLYKNIEERRTELSRTEKDCSLTLVSEKYKHKRSSGTSTPGAIFISLMLLQKYWNTDENKKMIFLFLVIKSRGKFHDPTIKDLQYLTGWSYNTVKKYLKLCQKNGLIDIFEKSIVGRSWQKMTPKSRGKHIILKKSYQQFCEQVREIIFDKEISSQAFMINLRNTYLEGNVSSVPKIRDLKRNVKKYLTRPQQGGKSAKCVRHGYRGLSGKLGMNISKVKEELERFVEIGLINSFESKMYYGIRSYRSTTKFILPVEKWTFYSQRWTKSFSSSVFSNAL